MGPFIPRKSDPREDEIQRIMEVVRRTSVTLDPATRRRLHSGYWTDGVTVIQCQTCGFRTHPVRANEQGWDIGRQQMRRHRAEMAIQDGLDI